MAHYRCFFLGLNGKIIQAEDLEAETASEAIEASRRLCTDRAFSSFELWERQHCLHREVAGEDCGCC